MTGVRVSSTVGTHDYYTEGEVIRVQVTFRKPVNVDITGGTPTLKLRFKPADAEVQAAYESGTGTATLTFAYTVLAADASGDDSGVAVSADSLALNGGSITAAADGAAVILGYAGLAHDTNHKVDGSRDITPPRVSSAETSTDGSQIIVTFNEALSGPVIPGDFRYSVDGAERAAPGNATTDLTAGKITLLGVVPAIEHGQVVNLNYTRPSGTNVLSDTSNNALPSFTGQTVTNQVPDTTPPRFADAKLNREGNRITITFDEELDDTSVPAVGDFTITVNGVVRPNAVSAVQVSGTDVVLTLSQPVAPTDEVQVGYSQGANRLRDKAPQPNDVTGFSGNDVEKAQPVVTAIVLENTPADGHTFRQGEQIAVRVTFSEPVRPSGGIRPRLTVHSEDGWFRGEAQGAYERDTDEYTTMVFSYVVRASDHVTDKLVFGTHATHGGGMGAAGSVGLVSEAGLELSPVVDPVTFNYKVDGGAVGNCRQDIGLRPWNHDRRHAINSRWGADCQSRDVPGRHSKYYTFTINGDTKVRLHAEGMSPWLILREGRSYAGASIAQGERFDYNVTRARIERTLEAGTYTLEVTTRASGRATNFSLWASTLRALPKPPELWTATLNPANLGGPIVGCLDIIHACHARLSSDTFTHRGTTYEFTAVTQEDANVLFISLDKAFPQGSETWVLYVGETEFRLADATLSQGDKKASWEGHGLSWAVGVPVALSLIEPNPCVEEIERGANVWGAWDGSCHSTEVPGAYARYYTYTPDSPGSVHVMLGHSWANEALYLYEGDTLIAQSHPGVQATIFQTGLKAGVTYTIEVTTRSAGETGNFLLALRGRTQGQLLDSDYRPEGAEVAPAHCRQDVGNLGNGTINIGGTWEWPCHSVERPVSYARYHTFTLTEARRVVVELGSVGVSDAVLFVREGTRGSGDYLAFSDDDRDVRAMDAVLEVDLQPGIYTIESAIGHPRFGGSFYQKIYANPIPAPPAPTLVGNLGQPEGNPPGAYIWDHAQTFTTGSHGKGYRLAAVQVRLGLPGGETPNYEVEIWTAGSDGRPHAKLATLAKPPNLQRGINTFTSAEGIDLRPSTRYSIVFNLDWGGTNWEIRNTASDAEDPGALTGWSIDDGSWYRSRWSTGSWTAFDLSRMVAFLGSEIP